MSNFRILLIAFSLSLDAFAVSVAYGIDLKNIKIKDGVLIGFFFGFFQAAMPVLGYFFGAFFYEFIKNISNIVSFAILFLIGLKMIYEAFSLKEEEKKAVLAIRKLFLFAIATSIDAFAIGITFSFREINIFFSVVIIGVITFFVSLFGVFLGKKVGFLISEKSEMIGGIILIVLAFKMLFEH